MRNDLWASDCTPKIEYPIIAVIDFSPMKIRKTKINFHFSPSLLLSFHSWHPAPDTAAGLKCKFMESYYVSFDFNSTFNFSPSDTDNQRVIIHVKDINDEPPYFINRPLPMQAVVQLNAPPNTPVFTLQARDPDTDHNIHYFIVRDRTGGR